MARVKLLKNDEAVPEIRDLFRKMEQNGGRVLNIFRAVGNSPQVGRNFLRLGNAILYKGTVAPTLRELAILRVGDINEAKYEWTQHVRIALRAGVRKEQIDALPNWENSEKFNSQERAVLQYTDELTRNIRVKDQTFADLRSFLSDEGIVELTITIGYYGMVCRLLEGLQVELEEGIQ
jgi:4-carboxymuconolactone decarboxylase